MQELIARAGRHLKQGEKLLADVAKALEKNKKLLQKTEKGVTIGNSAR